VHLQSTSQVHDHSHIVLLGKGRVALALIDAEVVVGVVGVLDDFVSKKEGTHCFCTVYKDESR
jgi:hypothetical protein